MRSRTRAASLLGAAASVALTCGFAAVVGGANAAHAAGMLVVVPAVVAPGARVTVDGRCPDAARDPFVRATVGVDALGRYAVVPVAGGAFSAKVTIASVNAAPAPGTRVRLQVTCRTAAAFVASVGTRWVHVVTAAEAETAASALASASLTAETIAAPAATRGAVSRDTSPAAAVAGGDSSIPLAVPLAAFGVAVIGTLGAYALTRRSDRRAEAMAGHPAQRGVGREPRRARK